MKNIIYLIILFTAVVFGQSREKISPALNSEMNKISQDEKVLVWIFFSDKGNDTEQYYSSPSLVVSEKSLNRRMKSIAAKGNLLDFSDLPVYTNYINAVEQNGFVLRQKSKWFNGVSGYINSENISRIAALPFVRNIDIVRGFKKDYKVIDSDNPEGLNKDVQPEGILVFNYGTSYTQLQQINVPSFHNLGYYGQGVTICVMDAGFNRLTHESFSTMNIIAAWDFVNGDGNVGDENDMGTGTHGTQTLSTIGGFKDGKLLGPAFDADYILAKTENTDSETPVEEDNWIAAMEWADSIGVDVTSTSLGYLDMDFGFPGYTWQDMNGNTAIITKGADLAAHKGIVVVNSAGNEAANGTPNTLSAPADGDSVIAVGAVTSTGTRSSFSSYGPTFDGRIKPDIMAMGSSVYVASPYSNTGYTTSSGTSFSCPLAAGVAALVLCYNPNLTPMQIRDALRLTASKSINPDNMYGWGIVNAVNAANYFPLPVELTYFEAYSVNEQVVLKWTTATESNNKGFEIQRSDENKNWNRIGFIDGKGTSATETNYNYTDNNILQGKSYYRLKQIDFNGTFSYSSEVLVDVNTVKEYSLFPNYPNPFNPSTTIKFSLPEKSSVSLKIYNVLGSEIRTLIERELESGTHTYLLDAGNLTSGVYFVSLKTDKFNKTIKINLLK